LPEYCSPSICQSLPIQLAITAVGNQHIQTISQQHTKVDQVNVDSQKWTVDSE
jgi:hypothetical protein